MNLEDLIKNSLQELQKIGWENEIKTQYSKLIFPKYRNNGQRISEQEARLLFVRELEKQDKFYYSIETPTKERYEGFSKKGKKPIVGSGRSGSIDVTLYEKEGEKCQRKHLIEFKFGNVDTCTKDFLKLLCDDDNCKTNYYINIIKNSDETTKSNLEDTIADLEISKYETAIEYIFKYCKDDIKSKLKIFICILNDIPIAKNNILEYHINKENQSIKTITELI